jgi:hypothetical protein
VVGGDLVAEGPTGSAVPVSIIGAAEVSGLADMLHQFLEQTLAESPLKAKLAGRLRGDVEFRAAEDEALFVRIVFAGDRIELHDRAAPEPTGAPRAPGASITADFLTIAHLTSGQESPLGLLARRKLRVHLTPRALPFLLGMLRFMRIERARPPMRATRARWAWGAAATTAGGLALYWIVTTYF